MIVITLTADEAAKVRGRTSDRTALDPIAFKPAAGEDQARCFSLPIEVLSDPAHADALKQLKLGTLEKLDPAQAPDAKALEQAPAKFTPLDLAGATKRDVADAELKQSADIAVQADLTEP